MNKKYLVSALLIILLLIFGYLTKNSNQNYPNNNDQFVTSTHTQVIQLEPTSSVTSTEILINEQFTETKQVETQATENSTLTESEIIEPTAFSLQVTEDQYPATQMPQLTPAPDDQLVDEEDIEPDIYLVARELNGGLFIRTLEGELIGKYQVIVGQASINPDQTIMAFSSLMYGYDFAFLDLDTEEVNTINLDRKQVFGSSWSPDGSQIVVDFIDAESPAGFQLGIYDVESRELTVLDMGELENGFPTWSKDGEHIAFLEIHIDGSYFYELNVMDTTCLDAPETCKDNLTNPFDQSKYSILSSNWSADSTKLLMQCYDLVEEQSDICLGDVNTGIITNITNSPEREMQPFWTVDGEKILFSQKGHLYLMGADGSNPKLVVESADFMFWLVVE